MNERLDMLRIQENRQISLTGANDENVYSFITESEFQLKPKTNDETPYADYNVLTVSSKSSAPAPVKKKAFICSGKRFLISLVVAVLLICLVSSSAVIAVFMTEQQKQGGNPPVSDHLKATRISTTTTTTTPATTPTSTTPTTAPTTTPTTTPRTPTTTLTTATPTTTPTTTTTTPTTPTTTLTTTIPTTNPTTILTPTPTTTPTTTTPTTTTTTTTPTTPTTTIPTTTTPTTTPEKADCSTSHRCHDCTSHETNGRCYANGKLVDTVKFGMVALDCTKACYAEVRVTDNNFVHRGCVVNEGEKIVSASQGAPKCVQLQKWYGAEVSTFCFCCGDLCNVQDMTQYGGIDV